MDHPSEAAMLFFIKVTELMDDIAAASGNEEQLYITIADLLNYYVMNDQNYRTEFPKLHADVCRRAHLIDKAPLFLRKAVDRFFTKYKN